MNKNREDWDIDLGLAITIGGDSMWWIVSEIFNLQSNQNNIPSDSSDIAIKEDIQTSTQTQESDMPWYDLNIAEIAYWWDCVEHRAMTEFIKLFSRISKDIKILTIDSEWKASNAVNDVYLILKSNPKSKVIVVITWNDISSFNYSAIISHILKYPNVRTINWVSNLTPWYFNYCDELNSKDSNSNDSFQLLEIQKEISSRILWILKHDLPKVIDQKWDNFEIRTSTYQDNIKIFNEIMQKARDAFEIKEHVSDQEIVRFIMETPCKIEKVMEWEIEWVYCDIDDTILTRDNEVIYTTLEIIQRFESEGKKIHIWTWWDLEVQKKRLENTPFSKYEILRKSDYAWANAEIIIDNVSPEKFALQTWITAKRFVRV